MRVITYGKSFARWAVRMYEELVHQPCYVSDPRVPWNIDEARSEELRLLDLLYDLGSTKPAFAAEVATQVARAQAVQGRLVDANDTLSSNERRLRALSAPTPRVRQLLERGRVKARERNVDTARLLVAQAYNAAREAGDVFLQIDAAQVLAVVEPPKQRDAWLAKAVELAQASTDAAIRAWIPALDLVVGWRALHDRADVALAAFERAARQTDAVREPLLFSHMNQARARALRLLGRQEEAMPILRTLVASHAREGRRDGRVLEDLAECLLAANQPANAQVYFAEAHILLSRDPLAGQDQDRMGRLKRLAKR